MSEFRTTIDIDASREVVFEYLVTAEGMVAWLGQHAELEPVRGGGFAVTVDGTPFRGRYLEVEPPRRVVLSWGIPGNENLPPGGSRVEFTLHATETGTRLELVHSGLPEPFASEHPRGWEQYLSRLRMAATC